MSFLKLLQQALEEKNINDKIYKIFSQLYKSYSHSIREAGMNMEECEPVFAIFLDRVKEQFAAPFAFRAFHKKITFPFDYYGFGMDFARPLVDEKKSFVRHLKNVAKIQEQILAGENVILFANHQTEIDPQLLSIILEKGYPELAQEVIFVAGDRVLTDPLAIPFSMGRNLLCIYSKRHINHPPEKKLEKQHHNQRAMRKMKELFSEGGKFIYVAPSGGRDRLNEEGKVTVAPFDPGSIEMFRLMAMQSGKLSHFYPLALDTFDILPPPQSIENELGEMRKATRDGILFSFLDEIDMKNFPGHENPDRHARREVLAKLFWEIVSQEYESLKTNKNY